MFLVCSIHASNSFMCDPNYIFSSVDLRESYFVYNFQFIYLLFIYRAFETYTKRILIQRSRARMRDTTMLLEMHRLRIRIEYLYLCPFIASRR